VANSGQFRKGVSGNPGGRRPDSAEMKKAKALLKEALIEVVNKGFYDPESVLESYLKEDIPVGIRAFLEQIKKQDVKFITLLFERVLGKPLQQTEIGLMENETVEGILKKIKEGKANEHEQRS
jgi:hypothetical protein